MSHPDLSRRQFVGAAAALGALTGAAVAAPTPRRLEPTSLDPSSLDPEKVRSVVGLSHSSLDGVRALVDARPELAKASWDWGFGDWESALGAASHTGRREIALYLIDNGARPNLFTHAMLGHLDVVKATIETQPGIQRVHGPHGITLLAHAKAGSEHAAHVAEYLEALGDADVNQESHATLTPDQLDAYTGAYRADGGDEFEITNRRDRLAYLQPGGFPRALFRIADHTFSIAGAPSVHLAFTLEEGVAVAVAFQGSLDGPRAARID
jgi:hypothetical protein